MSYSTNQPPGSPPIFHPATPPPRPRESSPLSLSDGQFDPPINIASPSSPGSRFSTPPSQPGDTKNPQPHGIIFGPQYERPGRSTSIPKLSPRTTNDTSSSEEEDNLPTSTSTSTAANAPKDYPTYTEFLHFHARTTSKYGPHHPPTPQEWGKEITFASPKMYYQVAFMLWREAWEREHPPPRSPSPEPHHTVAQIKGAIKSVNLIETPNLLVKQMLVSTNFPLFPVGHHDAAEFVLVPAPEVISSLKSVYAPWDKQLLGPHMLSLLGNSYFIFHVLGTLRKREIYERDLPFRESGYCICVQVDGRTGRTGRVYAIKSQAAGDTWLGRIADGVEELGPGLEMPLTTVFPRAQRGVRTARVLVVEEERRWFSGEEGSWVKGKREILRGSHWYADEVGVEKAWEID